MNKNQGQIELMPKKLHQEKRMKDIIDAMKRYSDTGLTIPSEWINELAELNNN